LERPLANEDGEFAVALTDVFGLTANGCRDVLGVCSSGGEEVDVRAESELACVFCNYDKGTDNSRKAF
jgi:hypothetical protein